MKARNLTMYALAQRSDLSQACIANWYNKRNYQPSVDALEKICTGLEITMAELFSDEDAFLMPLTSETKQLVNDWHKLENAQKQAIISHIKSYLKYDD